MEIPGRDALKRVAEQAILELKTQQLSQDTNANSPKVPYFILSINFILKFLRCTLSICMYYAHSWTPISVFSFAF
jgi:hypothetical protein